MKKLILSAVGLAMLFFSSCNNDDTGTSIVVRLTDSPGDYEAVNIDLQSVEVHASAGNQSSGWTTLNTHADIYDLLTLTNGIETVIANDNYPAGKISQIRLVLGDNNSVVIDGEEIPLTIPSGAESGLKLQINADLIEGITYSVLLDFDAAKSVLSTGSGKYVLKPVIKSITEAQDGAVSGTVVPADLNVAVYAISLSGEDTLSTSYAVEGNSDYFLGGLADGNYNVSFDPGENSLYQGVVVESVAVAIGEITDLGETVLVE